MLCLLKSKLPMLLITVCALLASRPGNEASVLLALCTLEGQEVTTKGVYRLHVLSTSVASQCQTLRELLVWRPHRGGWTR